MFLAHLLPRKIFNLITLRTEKSFFVTINVLNCGNKGRYCSAVCMADRWGAGEVACERESKSNSGDLITYSYNWWGSLLHNSVTAPYNSSMSLELFISSKKFLKPDARPKNEWRSSMWRPGLGFFRNIISFSFVFIIPHFKSFLDIKGNLSIICFVHNFNYIIIHQISVWFSVYLTE